MNSEMTTNSQLSTTEHPQNIQKQTKQTTRTETVSQKWRSYGGISAGRGWGENGGKGTGNQKCNWQAQNRQGEVKDSVGNGEAKELIYTTRGHEIRVGENAGKKSYIGQRGIKGRKKWDNCNSIINKIFF